MKSEKRVETVEQFLQRGGKITQLKPHQPRRIQRTRSHSANLEAAIKELWKGNYLDAITLASN